MKVDSLQKLCSSLEPILRRVVSSVFYCIGTLSTMLGFVFKKINLYSLLVVIMYESIFFCME